MLTEEHLAAMRAAFRSGEVRRACLGCEWKPLCDEIAGGGFVQAVLTA